MRDHTSPILRELSAAGANSVSVTPGAAQQPATFNISGIPPVTGDMRNYAQAWWLHLTTTFDPDAAGNAVSADKLPKVLASARLFSPLLGEVFPATHSRGSVVTHIIDVIAGNYQYPQHARAQLPASTDSDVTLELYYMLPQSYECLIKPHETAQWVGFFDQGFLEATLDVSTALDGDYAGAVLKAPTSFRAWVEMLPSNDVAIGVPCQWRERVIAGGASQFILKGVGQETNWVGIEPGCGLAFLGWLTDATGIGLSGADGVDAISAVELPWRSQQNLQNLDGIFAAARRMIGQRAGQTAGTGSTIIHDGASWPNTMDSTPNGRFGAHAQAMVLPLVLPGREFETSKAQRVVGDLPVNFTFGSVPSGSSRFVSWELLEFSEDRINTLAAAMGVDLETMQRYRKAARKNGPAPSKLRYTRTVFKAAA